MKSLLSASALLLSVFVPALCLSQPVRDFKGIELGKSISVEKIESLGKIKCTRQGNGVTLCEGSTTVAEVPADVLVVVNEKNEISSIRAVFDARRFDAVLEAAKSKYGAPDELQTTPIGQDRAVSTGGTFVGWTRGSDIWISLQQVATTVEWSALQMTTSEGRAVIREYAKTLGKKAAKDL